MMRDRHEIEIDLLANIKARLPELDAFLAKINNEWGYEDGIYRFYHHSMKVYWLQSMTLELTEVFKKLAPDQPLNKDYMQIIGQGTGIVFDIEHNRRWLEVTRPIVEAFSHARYFLEMMCKYGRELDEPPQLLPSGWAAVLYLYNLR